MCFREESLKRILEYGNKYNDISKEKFNELIISKDNHYKELIKSISPQSLLPGISDFLKEVHSKNIPMVIASANENAPNILNSLGVLHYFDYVINPKTLKKADLYLCEISLLHLDSIKILSSSVIYLCFI